MTASGIAAAEVVVYNFIAQHFSWLPHPAIVEDSDWTATRYHATKDSIFIPHYTDSWNEGRPDILIHETGHVLAWNSEHPVEGFLAAMGADPALLQFNLINEVFAEHFARAYVDGYDGHNYPALVNTVPFDATKMRAFCEGLRPIVVVVIPATTVVAPTAPEWRGPLPGSNWMPGRDGSLLDRIVVHHMAGTAAGAEARFRNPSERVSAHFGILRDGRVWQWVSSGDTAYHAGEWNMNLNSIGIEHEDNGSDDFTDAEYAASAALVRDLCTSHGIPLDRAHVIGHREVVATACPGALDIDRIIEEAGGDMATEQQIREWAKQEARAVLAQEYGPALEAELAQRLADNSTADVGAAVAESVKAVSAKLAA